MNQDITRNMLNVIRGNNINNDSLREHSLNEDNVTRKMLNRLNEHLDNFKKNKSILNEENENNQSSQSLHIDSIPSFNQTVNDWKNNIKQNIQSNTTFNSFLYYPKEQDIVINFTINDMNDLKVQMRLNDSSGNGIYIWINGLQLNDINLPKIQHIKAAYDNWRSGLIKDSTVLDDLKKFLNKNS